MSRTRNRADMQGAVEGRLLRGGTSKGFFVRESELPDVDGDLFDAMILELFGTPDPLQVDGLGGSHSHTSKLMIVGASDREDADIEYTFGQVAIEKPAIDWSGNCGNLTGAIGAFAMMEGLVEPSDSPEELTLYNTNTDTTIEQTVPHVDGVPDPYGDYSIDGVPGTGARIDSTFLDPAGGVFGDLTPTGRRTETVAAEGEEYEVSLVEVGNPCVFVRAEDVGMTGIELPEEMFEHPDLLDTLELIRGAVCERLGLVDDPAAAASERPTIPFIAVVSEPQSYDCSVDRSVAAEEIDVTARIVTTQTPHHAYAMTGAMCLAAATQLPETVPNEAVRGETDRVTIGHPKGVIEVGIDVGDGGVESVTVSRTARELMRGTAFYRYVNELEQLR